MADFSLNEVSSVKDKVVIVTGANSGIGFEIAQILASNGARVIIACRDDTKGLKTEDQIFGCVRYINLDLSSFASIESFSKFIRSEYSQVDILINNAGVMVPPFTRTSDKLELTFGVNYIGYYLLTNSLMPVLREVKGSRVVNMSSISQYKVKRIDWENINSEKKYSKVNSYAQSNLFRVMFTLELEDKLREKQYETMAVSCHPGVTVTNLYRFIPRVMGNSILTKMVSKLLFQTPYQAAMPALMACSSLGVKGGDFVGLDTRKQYKGNPKIVRPNELALDKELRKQLWRKSIEFTGIDLD